MRIVTPTQMKQIEQRGAELGISTLRMMENAGSAAATFLRKKFDVAGRKCVILCGKGGNGGDGFVIARKLFGWNCDVTVVMTDGLPKISDSQHMFDGISSLDIPILHYNENPEQIKQLIQESDIVVDAVYGISFRGELDELHRDIFTAVNSCTAAVAALDVPSGVNALTADFDPNCIKADFTIVFDSFKPVHLFSSDLPLLGELYLTDIGIPEAAHDGFDSPFVHCDNDILLHYLEPKPLNSYKGSNGKLLNIAGSLGMAGAAVMSTDAALKSGAGYVTLAIPHELYPHITPHLVSPVCLLLSDENRLDAINKAAAKADAVAIGCGLANDSNTAAMVLNLTEHCPVPMVIDASGINALAADINIIKKAAATRILTPHLGEFSRLCSKSISEIKKDRISIAKNFAEENGVILVLKGANTIVASPDGMIYVNQSGCPGLAKAGSGDVLTGIIASFAAQGIPAFAAAVCGVYIHGLSAQLCSKRLSEYGMQPIEMLEDMRIFLAQNNR
ncbi:MAG: NAD(P)H-hydrate dehydratase [Oscillospiraceae bacterium]|nr:NAD(P)H-hydrate dehydratase [Oscillospiraceae bacterium]